MLQKLTEASIRLLHKGVIPSQLQEQLHQLASVRKKAKREKYVKLEEEAPRQYSEVTLRIDPTQGRTLGDQLHWSDQYE